MWKQIIIVVALAILFTGVGWRAGAGSAAPASADTLKVKIARDIYAQMLARWRNNERYDIEDLELWSQHVLDADLDLATDAAERGAAYEEHVKRTTELARIAKSFARTGQGLDSTALSAEYYRLDALSRSAKGKQH